MEKIITRRTGNENDLAESQLHPLLQRIFAKRGISDEAEVAHRLDQLISFDQIYGLMPALTIIKEALAKDQHIMIVGDFDADGATSTALAVIALKQMGAKNVSFLVPNRFDYGYGLSPEIVDVALKKSPDVLITVDNGISSIAGVEKANASGVKVIITDHHLAGDELPAAAAIINPNQPAGTFPSKNLAGVGVIFYVMLALRRQLIDDGWFDQTGIDAPNMAALLDLVALGTVADVVPLDQNNRILVQHGLMRIRAGKARPGIAALLKVAGRDHARVSAQDIGFAIGPRLNAAGRLDDMSMGIEALLSTDEQRAHDIAIYLDQLNKERKVIEQDMQAEALNYLNELKFDEQLPFGLCMYDPHWHQGVIGLLASRIKDRIHRPVIVFAKVSDTEIKGSARSISGVHIRDVLDRIAKAHPELITKFGGHAMAAGLSIHLDHLERFKTEFNLAVEQMVDPDQLTAHIDSDGELPPEYFKLSVAALIHDASPWGQGFPEPLFDGEFELVDQRIVGQNHLKLLLRVPHLNICLDAIHFNVDIEKWPNFHCQTVKVAYRLDVNEFRGMQKLQLIINYLQAL